MREKGLSYYGAPNPRHISKYFSLNFLADNCIYLNSLFQMECINQFFKPETLANGSQWLCPQCKAPREAKKTFDIWRFPDYLIIHFKRYVDHLLASQHVAKLEDANL